MSGPRGMLSKTSPMDLRAHALKCHNNLLKFWEKPTSDAQHALLTRVFPDDALAFCLDIAEQKFTDLFRRQFGELAQASLSFETTLSLRSLVKTVLAQNLSALTQNVTYEIIDPNPPPPSSDPSSSSSSDGQISAPLSTVDDSCIQQSTLSPPSSSGGGTPTKLAASPRSISSPRLPSEATLSSLSSSPPPAVSVAVVASTPASAVSSESATPDESSDSSTPSSSSSLSPSSSSHKRKKSKSSKRTTSDKKLKDQLIDHAEDGKTTSSSSSPSSESSEKKEKKKKSSTLDKKRKKKSGESIELIVPPSPSSSNTSPPSPTSSSASAASTTTTTEKRKKKRSEDSSSSSSSSSSHKKKKRAEDSKDSTDSPSSSSPPSPTSSESSSKKPEDPQTPAASVTTTTTSAETTPKQEAGGEGGQNGAAASSSAAPSLSSSASTSSVGEGRRRVRRQQTGGGAAAAAAAAAEKKEPPAVAMIKVSNDMVDAQQLQKLVEETVNNNYASLRDEMVRASTVRDPHLDPYFLSVIGPRQANEDEICIVQHVNEWFDIPSEKTSSRYKFFAVYDGHNGHHAARFSRRFLHRNVLSHQAFETDWKTAIVDSFHKTDEAVNLIQESSKHKSCGTTALTLWIKDNKHLIVGNAGDCQGFIKRGDAIVPLAPIHSPSNEDEKARIKASGGAVVCFGTWRVNGVLAVSRSIGDPNLKNLVIATPDVLHFDLNDDDDFLILASDGLWDVVKPDELPALVAEGLEKGGREHVCKHLCNVALLRNTKDNVSVVVIFFRPDPNPPIPLSELPVLPPSASSSSPASLSSSSSSGSNTSILSLLSSSSSSSSPSPSLNTQLLRSSNSSSSIETSPRSSEAATESRSPSSLSSPSLPVPDSEAVDSPAK